jgi:hypothetical protein
VPFFSSLIDSSAESAMARPIVVAVHDQCDLVA